MLIVLSQLSFIYGLMAVGIYVASWAWVLIGIPACLAWAIRWGFRKAKE
ncbi:hypothetical protein [Vibrio variabilis]|nr:hypothetical protein [Vibrio variabilis]